ncbi:MAG: hypothetical protein E7672_06595 [Ruminococcaceae bacterium]|nr:hypothetical protein [Oscillospiraceae bacterium]
MKRMLAVLMSAMMLVSCSVKNNDTEPVSPHESDHEENFVSEFELLAASVPLSADDSRLSFVRAFLEKDAAKIEDLLALSPDFVSMLLAGDYSDFTLSFDEAENDYFSSLDLGFVSLQKNDIFNEGENHIFVTNDGFWCEVGIKVNPQDRVSDPQTEVSDAVGALTMWLSIGGTEPLSDIASSENEEYFWGVAGDYISCRYGVTKLDEYEYLANVIFGMETFEPRSPLMQNDDGGWYAGGHGSLSVRYDLIAETVRDDGTVSIKIKCYADYQGIIPSEMIEYILEDIGEEVGGKKVFRFVSYESVPLTEYPTFGYQF